MDEDMKFDLSKIVKELSEQAPPAPLSGIREPKPEP